MNRYFLEFLVVAAVVIVTPGPDTALTIRNSLLGGRRAGVFTAFGVSAGQATWAFATALGVAALIRASAPAFTALKLLGAAYLICLGAQALLAALRRRPSRHGGVIGRAPRRVAGRAAFRQGVISNLGNPKMAAFFPSLLPQFTGSEDGSFAALLLLGLLFAVMTLTWLTGYAVAVAKAGNFLRRDRIRRLVDAVVGAVLVTLGIRVATERR